jgi:hypothetical protein
MTIRQIGKTTPPVVIPPIDDDKIVINIAKGIARRAITEQQLHRLPQSEQDRLNALNPPTHRLYDPHVHGGPFYMREVAIIEPDVYVKDNTPLMMPVWPPADPIWYHAGQITALPPQP